MDGTLNITFRCTREILPYFDRQGGGNIVNIASMYGMIAPDFAVYGSDIPWNPPTYGAERPASAVHPLLCVRSGRRNIRVNSITPGRSRTSRWIQTRNLSGV